MIRTYVGPMFSGKGAYLLEAYTKMYSKEHVIGFKPREDSRDGAKIKACDYEEEIDAIVVNDISEIKNYILQNEIYTVFIDEAQFLTGDVSILVDLSVLYDIDFYIAGLNMTSEQKVFGIMGDILAISNTVVNVTGNCNICNKPTYYAYYTKTDKTGDIKVGDDGYLGLCRRCLKRERAKKYALRFPGETL